MQDPDTVSGLLLSKAAAAALGDAQGTALAASYSPLFSMHWQLGMLDRHEVWDTVLPYTTVVSRTSNIGNILRQRATLVT